MKNIILSILTIAFVGNAHAQWSNKKVKGNGNMTKITRTTSDYDGIKCAGYFDFVLVAGTKGKINIEGESQLTLINAILNNFQILFVVPCEITGLKKQITNGNRNRQFRGRTTK